MNSPPTSRKPRRVRHDPAAPAAPATTPTTRRLIRCPGCGATRPAAAFTQRHDLVARVQTFGGYKSCRWDDADLAPGEREALIAALERGIARLRAEP